jgi:branched-subunit amino acid transport protein
MTVWVVVAVVGIVTMLFKAGGPVFVGRRTLRGRVQSVVDLLAPVMLIALVVTQTVASGDELVLDARIPGVAAGALAAWLRAPIIVAMVVGAGVTAVLRLV